MAGTVQGSCHIPPDVYGGYVWFYEPDFDILGRLMGGLEPGGKEAFVVLLNGVPPTRPLTHPAGELAIFRVERCECFRVMFVPGVHAVLDNFSNRLFRWEHVTKRAKT